jgi:hypothetical protein
MLGKKNQKIQISDVLETANSVSEILIPEGRYISSESWGPDGLLYYSELCWALCSLYKITKNESYIHAVSSVLKRQAGLQMPSGGWALQLTGSGLKFKLNEAEHEDSNKKEDLPATSSMLRTIANYHELSRDEQYLDLGNRAFEYLISCWDSEKNEFVEGKSSKVLGLRANPKSYHIFFYWGMRAWDRYRKEVGDKELVGRMFDSCVRTFESYDEYTMPLIYALHAIVLMDQVPINYVKNEVRLRILNHLVESPIFSCNSSPGCYGHRDGTRGIVTTEAHMRSAVGILMAMVKYDRVTGSSTFSNMAEYRSLVSWIKQMRSGKLYYEYEDLKTGEKKGTGMPAQYLAMWSALGDV